MPEELTSGQASGTAAPSPETGGQAQPSGRQPQFTGEGRGPGRGESQPPQRSQQTGETPGQQAGAPAPATDGEQQKPLARPSPPGRRAPRTTTSPALPLYRSRSTPGTHPGACVISHTRSGSCCAAPAVHVRGCSTYAATRPKVYRSALPCAILGRCPAHWPQQQAGLSKLQAPDRAIAYHLPAPVVLHRSHYFLTHFRKESRR